MYLKLPFPLISGSLLCLSTLSSVAAVADTDAMDDLLKVLRDKGTISDSDYEALKKTAKTDTESRCQNT